MNKQTEVSYNLCPYCGLAHNGTSWVCSAHEYIPDIILKEAQHA